MDGVFPDQQVHNDVSRVKAGGLAGKPNQPKPKVQSEEDAASLFPFFLGHGPVVPEVATIHWSGPLELGSNKPVDNLEDLPQPTNVLGPSGETGVRKYFSSLRSEAAAKTTKAAPAKQTPVTNLESSPSLTDDLGPNAEEELRGFFKSLQKDIAGFATSTSSIPVSPSPTNLVLPRDAFASILPSTLATSRTSGSIVTRTSAEASSSPTAPSCSEQRRKLTKQLSGLHTDLKKPSYRPTQRREDFAEGACALAAACTKNRERLSLAITKLTGVAQAECEEVMSFAESKGKKLGN